MSRGLWGIVCAIVIYTFATYNIEHSGLSRGNVSAFRNGAAIIALLVGLAVAFWPFRPLGKKDIQ